MEHCFQSSKNEEITLPHEFILVHRGILAVCCIGAILSKKVLPQVGGLEKKIKKEEGDGHIGGFSTKMGVRAFCTLWYPSSQRLIF